MRNEEGKSLEDAISDTFDTMVAEEEIEAETTETETENVEEVEVSAEETEERTEEDAPEEIKAEGDEVTLDSEGDEIVVEAEAEYDEPAPERWSADMKEVYDRIPPEARKLMVEKVFKPMQRQYTESTTEMKQMREKIAPVMKIMEEYGGAFSDVGANPVDAIRRQAAWAAYFVKHGAEKGMTEMAKSFGVKGFTDGQAQDAEEEYMTPVERRLSAQVENVTSLLNQQQQTSAQRSKQQQQDNAQARYKSVHTELQSFINEQKDGKPLHPHVEKVAPQIAGLMKSGLVTQVDESGQPVPFKAQIGQAYKMAVDMNPSLRSAITPQSRQRQVAKVKAAQNVGVVTTLSSSRADDSPQLTTSDAVEKAFNQLERRSG